MAAEKIVEIDPEHLESVLTRSFLALEKIDVNIYRAASENLWHPAHARFVFGGQVVGQALVAACKTVTDDQHVHSLHCYFLRGGNINRSIIYHVDRTSDRRTYTSRNVKATQEGMPIFTLQTSFKIEEQDPLHHQYKMPEVRGPEGLLSRREILKLILKDPNIDSVKKAKVKTSLEEKIPVERRPTDPEYYFNKIPGDPKRFTWIRAVGKIGGDLKVHQCVAAYLSDLSLLDVALQPGGPNYKFGFVTSLDHTMWFHNPFQADEWMLFESESPQCGAGKALVLGRIWRRDGVLAVSLAQEGVVRSKI